MSNLIANVIGSALGDDWPVKASNQYTDFNH